MLREYLLESLKFFKENYLALAMIVLVIMVPLEIIDVIYARSLPTDVSFTMQLPMIILGLLVYPIVTASLIFYMAATITGESISIRNSWLLGLLYSARLFILVVIVNILIILGLSLLIAPGIYLIVRYSFSDFELLLNNQSPINAMKRSWGITADYFSIILRGLFVITLILIVPYVTLLFVIGDLIRESQYLDSTLNLAYSTFSTFYMVFLFHVYLRVRSAGEIPE